MGKIYTHVKLNFLATGKKLPKSLDLLARSETSSIAISLSNLLFSPKILLLSDVFSVFCFKIFNYNIKFTNVLGITNSTGTLKQNLSDFLFLLTT